MGLFILTETSAGYAILKAKDKKLLESDKLGPNTDVEQVCSLLKLKKFQKFDNAAAGLEEVAALVEGKVTPKLASLLDEIAQEKKASLAVADPKLASAIKKLPGLSLSPISDSSTADLYRSIREHLSSLIPELLPGKISTTSLGLSHSLSRHKLKFSPDKVDTMVVQAIALLDDLDKELNLFSMRVREWYGWTFPEMGRIIVRDLALEHVTKLSSRTIFPTLASYYKWDPEATLRQPIWTKYYLRKVQSTASTAQSLTSLKEIETAVKAAAEVSMGTEITTEDLENIQALAQQVVDLSEYRSNLSSFLSVRMKAIAPNLSTLVGDLVGARLISHAGSLMNLAKSPASTIQILGAEKALFRALKTKHDTPKYGLIFHASLIGQATGKNKAKIARVLAAKSAIGLRVDALAEWGIEGEDPENEPSEEKKSEIGREARRKIERKLAMLEGRPVRAKGVAIGPNGVSAQPAKFEIKEARKYNRDADGLTGNEPAAAVSQKSRKIEDVTPSTKVKAEPAISKDIEMADGTEGDDEDSEEEGRKEDKDEDMDEEEEEEEDEKEDEEGVKDDLTTELKAERPILEAAPATSNGVAETEGKPEEVEKGETPKQRARREKKERKRAMEEAHGNKDQILLARQVGLSLTRFRRKLERGEIKVDVNGKPYAVSKKELKRANRQQKKEKQAEKLALKAEKRAAKKKSRAAKKLRKQLEERDRQKAAKERKKANGEEASSGKKRKREQEDGEEKSEKKKRREEKKMKVEVKE